MDSEGAAVTSRSRTRHTRRCRGAATLSLSVSGDSGRVAASPPSCAKGATATTAESDAGSGLGCTFCYVRSLPNTLTHKNKTQERRQMIVSRS